MDDQTLAVKAGNTLFLPQIVQEDKGFHSRVTCLTRTYIIYDWPKMFLTVDQKLLILSYMTAFGRSEDESGIKWACWLYSYINMSFEMMKPLMQREGQTEYSFQPIPESFVKSILELNDVVKDGEAEILKADPSEEEEEVMINEMNNRYSDTIARMSYPTEFPEIELTPLSFPDNLLSCRSVYSVYGYCSLLIFLAGKKINAQNRITIEERRPKNLIDTYNMPEPTHYVLNGKGRMCLNALIKCNYAWDLHAPLRKAIITEVASFSRGDSIPKRVVYTVSKLLEFVGMQQAFYIHQFLQSVPDAYKFSCLRPAICAYTHSIMQLEKVNQTIRPYFKVIYGDQTKAFHRNSILPLAAVAISYQQRKTTSIRNYNLGEGATTAIAMFEREAKLLNIAIASLLDNDETKDLVME